MIHVPQSPAMSAGLTMSGPDDIKLESLSGKSILVTGAGGFIATRLIKLLTEVDCRIVRLLRRPADRFDSGNSRIEDKYCDVRDPQIWKSLSDRMDVVFHLAAQTSTYEANRDPRADLDNNVLPMLLMLQAGCEREIPPAVIYASTVTICGLPDRLPVDEQFPDLPVTVYDLHKQMAENYLKYHVRIGAAAGVALRLANVYGPGPRSSRADRGILNQMVGRALRGEALTVYGRGEQLRDYVHVDDAAKAFLAAATHVEELNGGHYIVGRGEGYSIAQALNLVAERVAQRTGKRVPVVSVDPPAGLSPIEARNFVADTSRLSTATGWRAEYPLPRGIDSIIESLT